MVAHPLVLEVVDRVLWPKKTTFQLHLTQSIAIGPGSPAQYIHRDHWCFDFFPFPNDVHVEVATIWALTDFAESNGATRVVPDSHLSLDGREFGPEHTVPAEMPRGSGRSAASIVQYSPGPNEYSTRSRQSGKSSRTVFARRYVTDRS